MRLLPALLVLALVGCSGPGPTPSTTDFDPVSTLSGEVTVFAAASLTETFERMARVFMQENPDVTVTLSFGGSSGLATQIAEGAPADVFAAASPTTMQASGATGAQNFATNVLEIAVPAGNEAGVTGLDDFANADLAIALCAVEVPCGAASDTLFKQKAITPSVDTYEQDVRAVLTKVELGEVDAGLVYSTDVEAAAGAVQGIEVDSAAVNYPIAQLTDNEAAAAFIAFVLSEKGQKMLAAAGFGAAA